MSVDSDLLSSCGLRLESEIYSDGRYSLCRVDYQGRQLIAEISSTSGVYQHRWPSVGGLITPVSSRDLPGQQRLVLFDAGDSTVLCERNSGVGRLSSQEAILLTRKVLSIVSDLQAAGMICGYLGPEMFIIKGSEIMMLAGRRGIPDSPFTPPEIHSSRPSDPRSDVSAIGSFLFRLLAGTDDREQQLSVWQDISAPLQTAIQDMVAASPVNRPSSLQAVLEILNQITEPIPETATEVVPQEEDGFVRSDRKQVVSRSRKKLYWIAGSLLFLALAVTAFIFSGPPSEHVPPGEDIVVEDSLEVSEVVSPWVDTVSVQPEEIEPVTMEVPVVDSAIIWVSNLKNKKKTNWQKDIVTRPIPAMNVTLGTVSLKKKPKIQELVNSVTWDMIIRSGRCGQVQSMVCAGLQNKTVTFQKVLLPQHVKPVTSRMEVIPTKQPGDFLVFVCLCPMINKQQLIELPS